MVEEMSVWGLMDLVEKNFEPINAHWEEMVKTDPKITMGEAAVDWFKTQGREIHINNSPKVRFSDVRTTAIVAGRTGGLFPDISDINDLAATINALIQNWRSEGSIQGTVCFNVKLPAQIK